MQKNSESTITTASLTDRFLDAVETPRGRAITYGSTLLAAAGTVASALNGDIGPAAVFGATLAPFMLASGCRGLEKMSLKEFLHTRSNLYGMAVISAVYAGVSAFGGYAITLAQEAEAQQKQESARMNARDEMSPNTLVTLTAKQAYCGAQKGWINPPGTQKKLNCK